MTRPETLWTRTGHAPPVVPANPLPAKVDTAIIGAGFTGLTAARALIKAGRRVAVFEAGPLGAGASARNAGFVVPNFAKKDPAAVRTSLGQAKGDALLRLVAVGAETVFAIIREDGIACDAVQNGWIQPAFGEDAAAMLRQRATLWRELGRPVRFMDAAEVHHETGTEIYAGGLIDETGGTIHPLNYLYGLARTVSSGGGILLEQCPITAVARTGQGWNVVHAKGAVLADSVLLCTNAFTAGIAARVGETGVPLRVYQTATTPIPEDIVQRISPHRRPVGDTRNNPFTYRLDRDNRLISGGMAIWPWGAEDRVGAAIVYRLVHELRLPVRPQIEITWTGVALMTPDFLPRIYEFGDGFWGGIGCNGRGIAMTAQLGNILASAALGTPVSGLPVPLAPARRLPLHRLAPIIASAALAHARVKDWMGTSGGRGLLEK